MIKVVKLIALFHSILGGDLNQYLCTRFFINVLSQMLNSLLFVLLFILWNKSFADVGNEQDIWNASNSPSKSWTSITMSAAGQFAAAATSNGPIYLSTDSGISWSQSSAPTERSGWLQIVSSQSCQYLAAITNDGPGNDIYLSANYGDTWVQAVTPDVYQWLCIASSASGQILVAGTAQSGTQYLHKQGLWVNIYANNCSVFQYILGFGNDECERLIHLWQSIDLHWWFNWSA